MSSSFGWKAPQAQYQPFSKTWGMNFMPVRFIRASRAFCISTLRRRGAGRRTRLMLSRWTTFLPL